jgi:hypothetical protein
MDTLFVVNLIGWLGSAAVIVAYVLVSTNRLRGDAVVYQLLNLVGGIFLALNTAYLGAYPSAIVNLMWIGIALFALARVKK